MSNLSNLKEVLYTAHAKVAGGREGHVESDDGLIKLDLRLPKEMGGNGGGSNPEQLFAAGYAASVVSWPWIRAHAIGASAEINQLRARAKALEDQIKGAL